MEVLFNDSDVLIESEDRAGEQERLRHIVEQPSCHVSDLDHLIAHQSDATHDEQHRTGVLRDFEAFVVFHGLRNFNFSILQFFNSSLHQRTAAGSTEEESDEVTDRLEDRLNCLVHNF